jgi:hypothetical protein
VRQVKRGQAGAQVDGHDRPMPRLVLLRHPPAG